MTTDSLITLAVLVVTVGALILDRVPPVYVFAGAVGLLLYADVIDLPLR